MQEKQFTCINCPKGCRLMIQTEGKQILSIQGFQCENGKRYAMQEAIEPRRILTSTVKINHGTHRVLPVITSQEIPFAKIEDAMKIISKIVVEAPVSEGDIIIKDFIEDGILLISQRTMKKL